MRAIPHHDDEYSGLTLASWAVTLAATMVAGGCSKPLDEKIPA